MARVRVFISFAVEDTYARDFLVGQARNNNSPFDFIDYSVREPWSESWRTKCRERIRSCSGFIALISPATMKADGARWEMKCAAEEGIPSLGIQCQKDDPGRVPPELGAAQVINWRWDDIREFIERL